MFVCIYFMNTHVHRCSHPLFLSRTSKLEWLARPCRRRPDESPVSVAVGACAAAARSKVLEGGNACLGSKNRSARSSRCIAWYTRRVGPTSSRKIETIWRRLNPPGWCPHQLASSLDWTAAVQGTAMCSLMRGAVLLPAADRVWFGTHCWC